MIVTYEANINWMEWLKNQPGKMWLEMVNNRLILKHDDCNADSSSPICTSTQYPADQEMDTKSIGCAVLVRSAERLGEDPCQPTEVCEDITNLKDFS